VAGKEFAIDYVNALELPTVPEGALERVTNESAGTDVSVTENDQLISIGSQIAEFADGVAADIRKDISNSLLLAQLAADKAGNAPENSEQWYHAYIDVLKNIGWVVEDAEWQGKEITGQSAVVHKEIIPFVTAALAGVSAPLVITLLEGLANMHKDRPWITLFEQESKRAYGGQFQIAHVRADDNGKPVLLLTFFGLDSKTRLIQILFLKLSESSVELKQGKTSLSINESLFRSVAPSVAQKVAAFSMDFIDNIDLGGISA